jgi:hypothetical protein
MAPEVMCRQNHGTSVDFFAIGVIAYELMFQRVGNFNLFTIYRDLMSANDERRYEIT